MDRNHKINKSGENKGKIRDGSLKINTMSEGEPRITGMRKPPKISENHMDRE